MMQILKMMLAKIKRFVFNLKYKYYFQGLDVHTSFVCDNYQGLELGERVYIGPYCHFDAKGKIELKDYCIIGPHVKIWSYNHDFSSEKIPYGDRNIYRKVVLDKGCWIGLGAIILPGAHIGEGAIIGAGAIVNGYVPPFSIVRPSYASPERLRVHKTAGLYKRNV